MHHTLRCVTGLGALVWGQFVTFKLKNEVSISQGKTGGWKVIPGKKNS